MMNRIMKPRAAALALAAPLLLAGPALADTGKSKRSSVSVSVETGSGSLSFSTRGPNGYHLAHHRSDRSYGYDRYELKEMKRRAKRQCRRAIRQEAHYIGFRDIDFDSRGRAYQIGPRGFEVTFREVEFEGRKREFERRVTCVVRRGEVRRIDGIPQRGKRHHRRNSYYGY